MGSEWHHYRNSASQCKASRASVTIGLGVKQNSRFWLIQYPQEFTGGLAGEVSCLDVSDEHIYLHVVLFGRHLLDYLLLERQSAGGSMPIVMGEEVVIEAAAPADAITAQVKPDAGNDDQIDVRQGDRQALGRLAEPER